MAEKDKTTPPRAARLRIKLIGRLAPERLVHEKGTGEEPVLCNTVNISVSGALVETSGAFPLGTLFRYSFRVPGTQNPVDVTAEVVRKEGGGAGGAGGVRGKGDNWPVSFAHPQRELIYRYGIRFLDMSDSDRAVVEGFLLG